MYPRNAWPESGRAAAAVFRELSMKRRRFHRIAAAPPPQRAVQRKLKVLRGSDGAAAQPAHASASLGSAEDKPGQTSGPEAFHRVIKQFTDAAAGGPGDVLSALGFPRGASGRSRDGAPPSVIFRALEMQHQEGRCVVTAVDRVAAVRWNARLAQSSLVSYASHLRMVAWGCRVFGIDPCQPDVVGIRRIAACVNNYSTLACWLSAWKCALEALGRPWPGDEDPVLRGIRRGTRRLQVPRMPRQRIRRQLLRRLLVAAVGKHSPAWLWWAFIGMIAHAFALRMPSELFAQFSIAKLRRCYEGWEYGPIMRKLRLDLQFAKSFCHCSVDPFLCVCSWVRI